MKLFRNILIVAFSIFVFCQHLAAKPFDDPDSIAQLGVHYQEDLSKYRIKASSIQSLSPDKTTVGSAGATNMEGSTDGIIPNNTDNSAVEAALSVLSQANDNLKTMSGHRVLVHSGTDKEAAERAVNDAQKAAYGKVGDRPRMDYEAPNYKVRMGIYLNRVKAYQVCKIIAEKCPTAIVTNEPVSLNHIISLYKKYGKL